MSKEKKKSVIGKAVDLVILKRIFQYVKPYRRIFLLAVTTTITLAFLSPLRPVLIQYTFDHYIAKPNESMLLFCTELLIGLLIFESFIQFADSFLTNKIAQNIIKDIRSILYKHVIRMRLKYYDNTPIGTLVTRSVSDIEVLADMFSDGLISIIGDLLKVLVILAVMVF